jgi:serine/threonine protein kinase
MSGTAPGSGKAGGVPDDAEPRVGNKIGPYRLVKLLGQGSTGRVFEVEHEKIGRRAAMKTLAVEHATRPGAIKRLFTEALAVNRINNPHIVEVTDLVENGEHHLAQAGRESLSSLRVNALVMELLEGQSLGQAMAQAMTEETPGAMSDPGGPGSMPPERFLLILAQVAEGLAAAHAAGFIHRDLKPDNIFLVERGGQADFVKLLDFGLTKTIDVIRGEPGDAALATQDGIFLGTPAYVSPEQASGKPVDHRTDVYALGVILFELVAGRLPFEGQSIGDYIIKHLTMPPPLLPEEIRATKLGRTLDAIIQRCLAKDPADRFPSAGQLAEIFAGLARGEAVEFTAMSSYLGRRPLAPGGTRRALLRGVLGVGAGVSLGALGVLLVGRLRGRMRGPARVLSIEEAPPRAAPPPPPPAAPVEPAQPGEVMLTFESEPPGAEARLAGQREPLGVTPFRRAFPRGDADVAVELTRPGYEPARISTRTATSRTISVTLRALPPARRTRRPVHRIGAETTIDPFR